MILNLLRSEWHKISLHPLLVLTTLGVFPVGAGVLLVLQWILYFAVADTQAMLGAQDFFRDALLPWSNLTALQGAFFRLLPLTFIALVFSNEYTSGNWKVILPGQRRWAILTVKAVVALGLVWLSLVAWSGVMVIGNGLPLSALGKSYFPDGSSAATQDFLRALTVETVLALTILAFLVALSGLVTVLTRATMPAVGIGVLFSLLESIVPALLGLANSLFNVKDTAGFLSLWQYLPSYAVLNMREWLMNGHHYAPTILGGAHLSEMSLAMSGVILAAWISVCWIGALTAFQRQDITS